MTTDQVNRDITDALLSSEATAIHVPFVVETSLDDVPSPSQDASSLGLSVCIAEEGTREILSVPNISVTSLDPSQNEIAGIQIFDVSDEASNTVDLTLIKDSVERLPSCSDLPHTSERFVEINNITGRDSEQADVAQVRTRTSDASIQSTLAFSEKCTNHPITIFNSDYCAVLNDEVSHDGSVENNGLHIIFERPFSSETSTGLSLIKADQENTKQLAMAQNSLDKNLVLESKCQETKDQRDKGEDAAKTISKTPISLQPPVQPLEVDSITITDCCQQSSLAIVAKTDNVDQEEIFCNPVIQDVIEEKVLSDPLIRCTIDDAHKAATEISEYTEEHIHKTKTADVMEFAPHGTATAIHDTAIATASCIEYEIDDIVARHTSYTKSIINTTGEEISNKTDMNEIGTVMKTINNSSYKVLHLGETDSKIGDIRDETLYTMNAKQQVIEPVTENKDSQSVAASSTVYNIDSQVCYIREAALNTEIKDSLGEHVQGSDSKVDTMTREANFEIRDFVGCALTMDSLNKVKPVLEIPVIEKTWHEADNNTVNNTLIPRQPSPPLSFSKPCNKCMPEGKDNTPVFTPAERLTELTANLLENVLIQIPKDPFAESDPGEESQPLVLGESEPEESTQLSTQLFHHLESLIVWSNDPVLDSKTENNPDTQLLTSSFLDTSIESPQINVKCETHLPLKSHSETPAIVWDLDSNSRGAEGEVTDVINNSKLSNELWLDACQFWTHEGGRSSILDECGHSSVPSPPETTPDNTLHSNNSQERGVTTGHWTGDWELPLVERWSSSESWASALSDWFQDGNVLGEDSTTTAKPPDYSNSAQCQTELCTDIQGSLVEQRASLEYSTSQETRLRNVCPHPTETRLGADQDRPPQGDNLDRPGLNQADEDVHSYTESKLQDLLNDSEPTLREKGISVEMVIPSGAFKSEQESRLQEGTIAPVLHGTDYTSGGYVNQCSIGTKLDTTVLRVTEHGVTQVSPDFNEEGERNYGPLRFSGYPSEKDSTPGCIRGEEQGLEFEPHLVTHSAQGNRHVLSELEHLTRTQNVETSHTPFVFGESESIVYPNSKDLDPTQTERDSQHPVFIMPFAPINIVKSLKDEQTSLKPFLIDNQAGNSTWGEETSGDQVDTCPKKSHTQVSSSSDEDLDVCSKITKIKTDKTTDIEPDASELFLATGERFTISEKKHVASVTLDLYDNILNFNKHCSVPCDKNVESSPKTDNSDVQLYWEAGHKKEGKMPPKTSKTSSESQTRAKHKAKALVPQGGTPSRKPDKGKTEAVKGDNKDKGPDDSAVTIIEAIIITEKSTPKASGKKKKNAHQGQQGATKPVNKKLAEEDSTTMPTSTRVRSENAKVKLTPETGKMREKPAPPLISTMDNSSMDSLLKADHMRPDKKADTNDKSTAAKEVKVTCSQEARSTCPPGTQDDDLIKRRRISKPNAEAIPIRTRPQLPAIFRQRKEEEAGPKRAYSDVVKQKTPPAKEATVLLPRVVTEIQASPVPDDAQSISLWCQICPVPADSTVTWTKEGSVLSQEKKGLGDDGRFTLSILKACSKNLGMYRCRLNSSHDSVSTSDYHLTSEVLMELVIPSHDTAESRDVEREEEDVHCTPLLFKSDILTDQYFGERQPASIVTEKAHFGEGMHRKAFRTTLQAGLMPVFRSGHPCVLKVHNAISYGTKDNEELVQKNYNLAVEECHVQNTAREYIKAYESVAKSAESFGKVPEIIPIYLVHRPSNNIPYATLEEELIGDFVKYSVADGREINLMRRDSEAGQKCCAFQHWVYVQTDGNLLVTDMQGVGMKLTDVGIATCRKGYKGFKGNCATSFIDQFKALHQCNRFCELLRLTPLQPKPKPKRTVDPPKPKTQPGNKKKPAGPVIKAKS